MKKTIKISKLKLLRVIQGLSQQIVSESIEIERSYLSKMERGKMPITENVLPKLMKFYKVKNKREIIG